MSAGRGIADIVAGAWRVDPPTLRWSSEGLADLVPLLVRGGAAALAWRRILRSEAPPSSGSRELQQAYRFNALQAAVQRRTLGQAVRALQTAGIGALLGKGLAAARLYPEPGLRPSGDIDLYVPAGDVPVARAVLADVPAAIDLHAGAAELDDRAWDDLVERSVPMAADGVQARTFGREDHLRLLALHMLRHGAWRPLWLCDVAAAAESASDGFDWDRVLGGDRRRADAVACALGLAQELLGARLDGAPAAVRSRRLPGWMVPAVLRQWGDPRLEPQSRRRPFAADMARPAAALIALVRRWPNPVEATLNVRAPFNDVPRLPFQLLECVRRTARFALG